MQITHQEIVDRLEALDVEHSQAYRIERARIDSERKSLEELCGGLGHTFSKSRGLLASNDRFCVFCNCAEPAPRG